MKSPKSRIEMFLRNPIRYVHAWWAIKSVQFMGKIGEYADNIQSQADYSYSEINDDDTEEKRFEKSKRACEVFGDLLFEIQVSGDIEWAEHRTSVYPDGRQYIEIWTYPPTTGEREDE